MLIKRKRKYLQKFIQIYQFEITYKKQDVKTNINVITQLLQAQT